MLIFSGFGRVFETRFVSSADVSETASGRLTQTFTHQHILTTITFILLQFSYYNWEYSLGV